MLIFLLSITTLQKSEAQIVRAGVKLGGQLDWVRMDDKHFRDTASLRPGAGFNAGLVLAFKVKNRYFLHTEYIYSTKSKTVSGKIDPYLKDKVTYSYFEVPILFCMYFKGQWNDSRNFKWYAGAGPNIAYLLGGHGTIKSSELLENNISSLDYKIKFGTREDRDHNDQIYYTNLNRLQFGINLGAGILLEPSPKQKIMVDLRYTFDQTLFGKQNADYIIPHDYNDNLRFRNRSLRLSVMYLLEYNISKKERNKGKSTRKKFK
ncbi:MAG TPA: porin family protein [Ohtaekwangia sp.]|uniref:porin family protein n=1 Tax=Ohtaekwangia sp. TaxID=2066019 RepID=UPI002F92C9EE